MPDELILPDIPEEVEYLYPIFWDLWNREGISWTEIYHYQLLMDIDLDGSDLIILRMANNACAEWLHEKEKPKKKISTKEPKRR